MAKRRGVYAERIAALFDFASDPFSFAPIHVSGESTRDRTRKVALLVAARSFLATGRWLADWAEIKAMTSHQHCYDMANFSTGLKKLKGKQLKAITVGTSIELSATGSDVAEQLLTKLTGSSLLPR